MFMLHTPSEIDEGTNRASVRFFIRGRFHSSNLGVAVRRSAVVRVIRRTWVWLSENRQWRATDGSRSSSDRPSASSRCGAVPDVSRGFFEIGETHLRQPSKVSPVSFAPFEAKNRRTEAVVEQNGQRLRVMKGAVRTVAEACGLQPKAMEALEARVSASAVKGYRTLAVARGPETGPVTRWRSQLKSIVAWGCPASGGWRT
jgi:hypothetical protein